MNTAPLASSVSVAMLNKFLRVLGEQGVVAGDLRAVIESRQFAVEVAELLRRGPKEPDYPVLIGIEYEAANRLISDMGSDPPDFSTAAMWDLADAINLMDGRDRDVLRLYYGLESGQSLPYKEVGKIHGISGTRTAQIKRRAVARLRQILDQRFAEANDKDSINALRLSSRTSMPLQRARITTVAKLLEQSENDLLALTNFNQRSLDEVKSALHERGLALRDG